MRLERFALSLSSGQSSGMAKLYRDAGARDLGPFYEVRARRVVPILGSPRRTARDAVAWLLPRVRRGSQGPRRRTLSAAEAAARVATLAQAGEAWTGPADSRAAEWFVWRYDGPVYRDHAFWAISSEESGGGVLVTRRTGHEERIVDLLAPVPAAAELLAACFATSESNAIATLLVGDALVAAARRAGYLTRRADARLVALPAPGSTVDAAPLAFLAGIADADLLRRP
jgi:hypothetical protein